jgi:hypothetical protein
MPPPPGTGLAVGASGVLVVFRSPEPQKNGLLPGEVRLGQIDVIVHDGRPLTAWRTKASAVSRSPLRTEV